MPYPSFSLAMTVGGSVAICASHCAGPLIVLRPSNICGCSDLARDCSVRPLTYAAEHLRKLG